MDPKERRSEALIVNVRPVDRTRLDKLSAKTGQSRSTIIHEAILAYLEEG